MEKISGHKLFLLDAIGAFVSIVFLFLLYAFDDFFGMPQSVILVFMCIAAAFCAYSTTTYLIKPVNWQFYLQIIATLNICYCLFTIYHILQNLDTVTRLGYAYFIAEIVVVLMLSTFELQIARKNTM